MDDSASPAVVGSASPSEENPHTALTRGAGSLMLSGERLRDLQRKGSTALPCLQVGIAVTPVRSPYNIELSYRISYKPLVFS